MLESNLTDAIQIIQIHVHVMGAISLSCDLILGPKCVEVSVYYIILNHFLKIIYIYFTNLNSILEIGRAHV